MISTSKIKEVVLENGYRILKILQYGIKTSQDCTPFGEDSHPLKDMTAIYAETQGNGKPVIIGYVHKNKIAKVGEKRIFSLTEGGDISFYIHLKNDGTCEINSDVDNAVRYSKLEEAFNQLKGDFNDFVTTVYNVHTNPANGTAPPSTQGVASQADIEPAKIEEIKVP